jgi:hypothetical protein
LRSLGEQVTAAACQQVLEFKAVAPLFHDRLVCPPLQPRRRFSNMKVGR